MSVSTPTSTDIGTNEVAIREFYKDFVPPRYVLRLVRRLVQSVPPKYSNRLDCVVLTNQSGAPRRQRFGKVNSRRRRVFQANVVGRYHRALSGKPAWIELYVDKIVAGISHHRWVPMAKTACFAMVLFHEVGHHVHTTVRPEFREREDVADDWGGKLTRNYFFKRYWFVPRVAWRMFGRLLKSITAEL